VASRKTEGLRRRRTSSPLKSSANGGGGVGVCLGEVKMIGKDFRRKQRRCEGMRSVKCRRSRDGEDRVVAKIRRIESRKGKTNPSARSRRSKVTIELGAGPRRTGPSSTRRQPDNKEKTADLRRNDGTQGRQTGVRFEEM